MPATDVRAYRDEDGEIPVQDWLDMLEADQPRAYAKCLAYIEALAEGGNELRRPVADSLDSGIMELRPRVVNVNYRILYFFCGKNVVCLSHGITKGDIVPKRDIETAKTRKKLVMADLEKYTADFEI